MFTRTTVVCSAFAILVFAGQGRAQNSGASAPVSRLADVRRVYVADLTGSQGTELRELIIASLDATKLFLLTENPDRADAVLKGAADDHAFTDSYGSSSGISTRENGGKYGGGSYSKSNGGYFGLGVSDSESQHIKERKHEAYAAVRLCSKDGDILWSTTQESLGAKFRGAGADVATKVARQLTIDIERARRSGEK